MDIRTQSALLASIVGLALGVSVLLRPGRPRVLTRYATLALNVGSFYAAHFFASLLVDFPGHPWIYRIAVGAQLVLGAVVPSTALSFFLEFLNISRAASRLGRQIALASVVFGLTVGLSPLAEMTWPKVAVSVWVLGGLLATVSLVVRRMRQSESRIERARLMYLASGAAASIFFTALDLLVGVGVPFPALGPVVTTLFLFLLAQTLLRLRLLDLHELLGKVASQSVLALILAAVFAILTTWAQGNFALFLFNTAVAAFVMLILLEPLREKVEAQVLALFFRERFELVRALGQLQTRMVNVIDVPEQAALVLDALAETRRVTHAAIYLLAEDRPGFRLVDHRGPQPTAFLDMGAAKGLISAAASGQKAVLAENVDRRVGELRSRLSEGKRVRDELKRLQDTRAALGQMKAGISAPLMGNDQVFGFLNLWDERVPEAYASDEIALILEVAEGLATTIENSKLFDKMRERDRLATLGEMSAGLAHEIRNPLGAIKGAAQCLDPRALPAEDRELVDVIVEEVNRLNGVVSAFLDYARPLKQSFGPTDLNEVVSRTVRLIENEIPPHITLQIELCQVAPRIDGDAEQLKQVLINLVQNGLQAMGDRRGSLMVRTVHPERVHDFRAISDSVELQVSDSGPGIPSEQQRHIFVPFFTTKSKGTGLGLAICQRIVKNHGGSISVQSRQGEGTTFVVRLPSADAPAELAVAPDLPAAEPGNASGATLAEESPSPPETDRQHAR